MTKPPFFSIEFIHSVNKKDHIITRGWANITNTDETYVVLIRTLHMLSEMIRGVKANELQELEVVEDSLDLTIDYLNKFMKVDCKDLLNGRRNEDLI